MDLGAVNWWHIAATDPQDDEVDTFLIRHPPPHRSSSVFQIPMTQLARMLDDNDDPFI